MRFLAAFVRGLKEFSRLSIDTDFHTYRGKGSTFDVGTLERLCLDGCLKSLGKPALMRSGGTDKYFFLF